MSILWIVRRVGGKTSQDRDAKKTPPKIHTMPKHGKNAVFADAGETLNPLNAKHLEINPLTGGQKVAGSNPVTPIKKARKTREKSELSGDSGQFEKTPDAKKTPRRGSRLAASMACKLARQGAQHAITVLLSDA